jgi:CCR4-NOT complex subunit CAF16
MPSCISIQNLDFAYDTWRNVRTNKLSIGDGNTRPVALRIEQLTIDSGQLVVFCGSNGAGKSTLLSILGGRRMVTPGTATIQNRECFNDCRLTSKVCYVGDRWSDRFLDMTIGEFLGSSLVSGETCTALCDILGIDLEWRISRISDGQRRRCQILSMFTASDEFDVYILDETTSDLDIISRERLLGWLKERARRDGATVLYATHILDGLNEWGTRLIYLEKGRVIHDLPVCSSMDIYKMVKGWLMEYSRISKS